MRARFLAALLLAFAPLFAAAPASADDVWWAQQNNEGDVVTLVAPPGWQFVYARAWYGDPDNWNCGADVSEIVKALMYEQTEVTLHLDNGTFGDPCGGVYKVTRFTWGIVPLSSVAPTPSPEPTPEPTAAPLPEPTAVPTIEPTAVPIIEPIPVATPEPMPAPQPEPAPQPQPMPAPEPLPTPTPEPIPKPAPAEPIPAPSVPTVAPLPPVVVTVAPAPAPAPPSAPPAIAPAPAETPPPVAELAKQDPQTLTVAEVALITEAAITTLATEPQGSPAYNEALTQLMVVAQADDPEVPTELASIPLLGNAAVAVLDAFNQLGNFGSDISPKVRKQAKKEAIATIAVGTATTASAVASSGAVSYRRKVTP